MRQVAQHFCFGIGTGRLFFASLRRAGYRFRAADHARSVVDPWGWVLQGANVLFYPSVIIFAGAWVLWAFRDADALALDARRDRGVST
jgi:hypothetical protein